MPRPLDSGFTEDYPTPHLDAMDVLNEIDDVLTHCPHDGWNAEACPMCLRTALHISNAHGAKLTVQVAELIEERDTWAAKYKRLKSLITEYLACDLTVARNEIDRAIDRLHNRVRELEGVKGETPISTLALTVRLDNCLRSAGIKTVEELSQWTERQLLCEPNLGAKSMEELREALAPLGVTLRKR